MSVKFSDRYTSANGSYFTNYSFMANYDALVAAYQETTMSAMAGNGDLMMDCPTGDCTFEWHVDGKTLDSHNATVSYTFTETRAYVVTALSNTMVSVVANVMCRYVRREIRSLFADDREAYLNAVRTVYSVRQEEGRERFGSGYRDAGYFINYHTWMAGTKACDHLHDGMGFLTGHNAITNEFEQNLQRVDPSVAIPYWDYTIDMHHVREQGKVFSVFYESAVFQDDWFGPMGDAQNTYQVSSGWVADNITVIPAAWGLNSSETPVTNAYGLLRSPWNVASVSGLIRANITYGYTSNYKSAPRCAEFYDAMNITDVVDFTKYAQANAHGAIHTFVGGVSNSNWKEFFMAKNFTEGENIGLQGFGVSKRAWRAGVMHCPSSCSTDTPTSNCTCHCPKLDSFEHSDIEAILMDIAGAFSSDTWYVWQNGTQHYFGKDFLKLVCGHYSEYAAPFLGDAMNSGAPADPSFWPTHPNIDRLFQHRRLKGMTGLDVWPEGSTQSPEFYWGGGSSSDCWGHQPNNTMIWKDIFLHFGADDDDDLEHKYTVYELWDKMDADKGHNWYVYDHFVWDHCAAEGIPADLTWQGVATDDDGSAWSR